MNFPSRAKRGEQATPHAEGHKITFGTSPTQVHRKAYSFCHGAMHQDLRAKRSELMPRGTPAENKAAFKPFFFHNSFRTPGIGVEKFRSLQGVISGPPGSIFDPGSE